MRDAAQPGERSLPTTDVGDLAEQEMSDKRQEIHDEERVRELYDIPSEDAAELAAEQSED